MLTHNKKNYQTGNTCEKLPRSDSSKQVMMVSTWGKQHT